jgi:hypothetical protein
MSIIFLGQTIPSKTVMVYGAEEARYRDVARTFRTNGFTIINMSRSYSWDNLLEPVRDHEGNSITIINQCVRVSSVCNSWLATIIAENVARRRAGRPLIPIIFCIGSRNNDTDESNLLESTELTTRQNTRVTASEVRRAFKLCSHSTVGAIARESFRFVNSCYYYDPVSNTDVISALEDLLPPWENPRWHSCWTERMSTHNAKKEKHTNTSLPPDHPTQPWLYSFECRLRDLAG